MIGYIVFVFFVLLFAYLSDPKVTSEKMSVYFRYLLAFTLAYMIGLGGNLATDNAGYQLTYKHLPDLSQLGIENIGSFFIGKYEDQEYGFVLFSLLLKKIGFSSVGFCFVSALITNLLIVKSFYKFHYPLLVYLVFLSSSFFAQEPNLIRQVLAISIFVFSLRFIVEKDWKKYIICVAVMFLIHHSSVITIIFLPFCFNISIHRIIKFIFLGLWVGSILIAFGKLAFDLTGLQVLMVGSEGYDAYLTDENRIGTAALKFNIVYNFLTLIYFIWGRDKKENNIYAYCFLIGAIAQNVSVQFINFYRMSLYFSVTSPVLISEMIYDFIQDKGSNKKLLYYGISIVVVLLYIRSFFISIISNSEYIGKEMSSIFDIF